ncbi:MAG: hypothetical protein V4476_02685 [Pseudomonadota bacterium]
MTFAPLQARAAACVLAASLLACPATRAGRPMTVDDAAIAAPGTCQLETYALHADHLAEYWATPACNVGGDWELGLGGAWADDTTGPRSQTMHHFRLQAKTVFKPLETNGWGLGLVLADQFRAGQGGDGDLSVNVPLSISLRDDAVLLHLNAGMMHAETGRRHHATWGSGAQFRVDERHSLTAEVYGRQHSGSRYQFGIARALIPDRLQIDATWGQRLARGGGEPVVTVGLVFQSR